MVATVAVCSPCLGQASSGPDLLKQAKTRVEQAAKEYDAALDLCRKVIESRPELEAQAKLLMGEIYLKKGRWQDAANEANRLVKKFPKSEEALRAMKLIYKAHITAGHPKGAENWLLPLVEGVLIPAGRGAEVLERLANIYLGMREYDKTLAAAHKLMNEYPDSPEVVKAVSYIRAVYQLRNGGDAALARMREFIAVHPGSYLASCAQYQIGGYYLGKRDRDRAIAEHEKLVREYPDSPLAPRVQRETAVLYFKQQKFDRAVAGFSKALGMYPDDPKNRSRVLRGLGVSYIKSRQYDKAIEQYQAVLQIEGQAENWYPFAESFIAHCHLKKRDYQRAIEAYEQVMAKYPGVGGFAAGAQYKIGYIHLLQGDDAKALAAMRKVVANHPDSSWVKAAKRKIGQLEKRLSRRPN